MTSPSYHDVHIETAEIPRTSIFNLPFGLMVACTRVGGWELFDFDAKLATHVSIAGEFGVKGLRIDVDGHGIVDSLTKKEENESTEESADNDTA